MGNAVPFLGNCVLEGMALAGRPVFIDGTRWIISLQTSIPLQISNGGNNSNLGSPG